MFNSAHKQLLKDLAEGREADLRRQLTQVRQVFGVQHPNVGKLIEELSLTEGARRAVDHLPAAAA